MPLHYWCRASQNAQVKIVVILIPFIHTDERSLQWYEGDAV